MDDGTFGKMKKTVIRLLQLSLLVSSGAAFAAPADAVTKEDLKALIERISKLEAENKAQAARIAELEGKTKGADVASGVAASASGEAPVVAVDSGTVTNDTGRIFTTDQGFKYYLADKTAGIFEPLTKNGLKITPYGYFAFEAVHNTAKTETDYITDWVLPRRNGRHNGDHQTTLSVQDSILGFDFIAPETVDGWTFGGKAEFDLAGGNANDYAFHWRHLYIDAAHESGWSFTIGQTWHLWKMVTPSEIDGAWLENTGHPYRRSPQLRVTRKWDFEDSSLEWRAGIVKNGPGMGGDRDSDGNQDNSASAWPLFESALIYQRDAAWEEAGSGKRWLVGLAGQYGRDKSRRPTGVNGGEWVFGGDSDEYDSSMIMVAGKVPFWDFTLTGQFFAGENLGGVQAGIGQRVGFEEIGRPGREVGTVGGFIDLNWAFNEDWSFAVGYGFDDPDDGDARSAAGRTYNDRAYINTMYRLTEALRLGIEYAHLRTAYHDEGDASDDRFQFSALYDF